MGVVKKTSIPSWSAPGFVAGNTLIRGIKIPSVAVGVAALDAGISNRLFGEVVPIPTWAWPIEYILRSRSLKLHK